MSLKWDDQMRLLLIEMTKHKKTVRDMIPVLGIERSAIHNRVKWLVREGYMIGKVNPETNITLPRTYELTPLGKRFVRE